MHIKRYVKHGSPPTVCRSLLVIAAKLPAYSCYLFLLLFTTQTQAGYTSVTNLESSQVRSIFPTTESLGAMESAIAARPVYGNTGNLLGYVALSHEIEPIPGYSGRPLSVLVGIDTRGKIVGINVVHHEEPILVIGIKNDDLLQFTGQYKGFNANDKTTMGSKGREGYAHIDGISGATITAMILNKSLMETARKVAQQLLVPELFVTDKRRVDHSRDHANWRDAWKDKRIHLVVTVAALTVLLTILFFQDWLVRHTALFNYIRLAFLFFTVFYLGFWHLAQLSIINVLTFVRSISVGFSWDTLLIDPVIFVLWGFVAISIVLWGRGVFCGWLCPFGAIQELIHKAAEKLKLPNWEFPQMIHERLWSIKYFILIALVGLSLESMTISSRLAEIEPFKTTFIFQYQRPLPYTAYALALLIIAPFNAKFFCKYLCALGAALSFITRFRVFDWLRRRRECGRPCQACAASCQIRAVKPTGEIIDTECHYCLECQVMYWDTHRCPPLVEKTAKLQRKPHSPNRSKPQIIDSKEVDESPPTP